MIRPLARPSFLDPEDAASRLEVLLSADPAAGACLAAVDLGAAEDDRSVAAPEAPAGSVPDEHPAAVGLDPAAPAESADPVPIEESPVATAFDHCDLVPADDYSGSAPDDCSAGARGGYSD